VNVDIERNVKSVARKGGKGHEIREDSKKKKKGEGKESEEGKRRQALKGEETKTDSWKGKRVIWERMQRNRNCLEKSQKEDGRNKKAYQPAYGGEGLTREGKVSSSKGEICPHQRVGRVKSKKKSWGHKEQKSERWQVFKGQRPHGIFQRGGGTLEGKTKMEEILKRTAIH